MNCVKINLSNMKSTWILLMLFVCLQNLNFGLSGRPYVHDPDCPRRPELLYTRHCLKKCRTDLDCRGRHKRCLCDGVCGKSCVKPAKPCEGLKQPLNGRVEIIPYNKFGARAIYSCNESHVLSGSADLRNRTCQGDGYWSGRAPTCETQGAGGAVVTTTRPNHSDGWFTPVYQLNPHTEQNPKAKSKCRDPPVVENAYHDGPRGQRVFPLGIQLNYRCVSGYQSSGFSKAMCVGDGRWVNPTFQCLPRRCYHPGNIDHGFREGHIFMYPHKVTYRCIEGYRLQGPDSRMCQDDGQWSDTLPKCIPVVCRPRLTAPTNGNMTVLTGSNVDTYGSQVEFRCHKGFRLDGSSMRRCKKNGEWGGTPVSCPMVDCGEPSAFYNGYLQYGSDTRTYGTTVTFKCLGRTTFEGEEGAHHLCQEDGEWSKPFPKCWSKCLVRHIENGSIAEDTAISAGQYVTHGSTLKYRCSRGHVLSTTVLPTCYNGTWVLNGTWDARPTCDPAPCGRRPPDLMEGIVRYYTNRHGDKAKYRCNTGYKLHGEQYLTCQYGNWTGTAPTCRPEYCIHPGEIENGQILLVGVIGKYEYRPYVKRIGHTKQIEYHCNKAYKRVGPTGATCVDGQWSPKPKPKCLPGRHPKLEYTWRRGRRSLPDVSDGGGRSLADVSDEGGRSLADVSDEGGRSLADVSGERGRSLADVSDEGGRSLTYVSDEEGHSLTDVSDERGRSLADVSDEGGRSLAAMSDEGGHNEFYPQSYVGATVTERCEVPQIEHASILNLTPGTLVEHGEGFIVECQLGRRLLKSSNCPDYDTDDSFMIYSPICYYGHWSHCVVCI